MNQYDTIIELLQRKTSANTDTFQGQQKFWTKCTELRKPPDVWWLVDISDSIAISAMDNIGERSNFAKTFCPLRIARNRSILSIRAMSGPDGSAVAITGKRSFPQIKALENPCHHPLVRLMDLLSPTDPHFSMARSFSSLVCAQRLIIRKPLCFAKSLQSYPTLCNLMNHSPPGSFVHGILQARTLEWVVEPSSRGSFPARHQTHFSYVSCICRQVLYH